MATEQQAEALGYFNRHAAEWRNKALSDSPRKVNVIKQRNDFVLHVVGKRPATRAVLDVGCGSGDLVCALARRGVPAVGVDFAPEMIALARAAAEREGLTDARFEQASIFDYDLDGERFDLVSGNGLIEYISLDELERLLDRAYEALPRGGSLVLGSRNRLFNLFSLNEYTRQELDAGTLPSLVEEALALAAASSVEELLDLEPAPIQGADSRHAHTGIDVATRYQFTPVQLMRRMTARGFRIRELAPVHVHGVPPAFKREHPEVHTSVAVLLQAYAGTSLALVPPASTFMLHAEK